jgi:hypothetical protein
MLIWWVLRRISIKFASGFAFGDHPFDVQQQRLSRHLDCLLERRGGRDRAGGVRERDAVVRGRVLVNDTDVFPHGDFTSASDQIAASPS